MVRLNADIEDYEYLKFKQMVGKNGLSETIRNLIKSFINSPIEIDKSDLENLLRSQKEALDFANAEYLATKIKIDKINAENEKEADEQRKRLKDAEFNTLKEQMSRGNF